MRFPAPIPSDSEGAPPPPLEPDRGETFHAEQDSLRRAMPLARLMGSGMAQADAVALHSAADAGVRWDVCGEWLGDRNLRLATRAATPISARAWYRRASACFRSAQAAIPTDTDRKRHLFAHMVRSFAAAGALDTPMTEKHDIPWRSGRLCGWLLRPPHIENPPVVIIMGGFDGWREEYHPGAVALVERGVAAFLMDGPGQGESRLFHGLHLDADFPAAFAAAADHLRDHGAVGPRIGIWGNSLGGFLAAATVVAFPDRFAAVCVNGGTVRPLELPERFPRFFEKVEALLGTTDRAAAMEIMDRLDISDSLSAIHIPLLQLHSVPDQVFLLEHARLIHDRAASRTKTIAIWEDGDHCIYNHSDEKNAMVADWFADRLASAPVP